MKTSKMAGAVSRRLAVSLLRLSIDSMMAAKSSRRLEESTGQGIKVDLSLSVRGLKVRAGDQRTLFDVVLDLEPVCDVHFTLKKVPPQEK